VTEGVGGLFSDLAQPLAFLWAIALAIAAWEGWHRRWRSFLPPAALVAILLVVGSTSLPLRLAASLERPWAGRDAATLPHADAVVMLGGELTLSPNDVFGFDLADAGDRAILAAELVRQGKAGTLVLGGSAHGADRSGPSEGELLQRWLGAWGLLSVPVVTLGDCRSTHDEAIATAALARERGWKSVLLVTSAAHMTRAEAVFRKAGVPVVPAPCDFAALSRIEDATRPHLPGPDGFRALGGWMHERIGLWAYRLRGWVD